MPGSDPVKPAGVKLTYDDFLLFPEDDGLRHELIDGEHYVTAAPNTKHQTISVTFTMLIASWLEEHPIGRMFHAPYDVILSMHDVVEPDLIYVSNARGGIIKDRAFGAPDLVIEIGSPATRKRDETTKLALYEREGVQEYWIVDTDRDTISIYRRDGDRFAPPFELSRDRGEVLTTSMFPGLELHLTRIFRV